MYEGVMFSCDGVEERDRDTISCPEKELWGTRLSIGGLDKSPLYLLWDSLVYPFFIYSSI